MTEITTEHLIKAIQSVLKKQYFYHGALTGKWSVETANAYLGWCLQHNVNVTLARLQPSCIEAIPEETLRTMVDSVFTSASMRHKDQQRKEENQVQSQTDKKFKAPNFTKRERADSTDTPQKEVETDTETSA